MPPLVAQTSLPQHLEVLGELLIILFFAVVFVVAVVLQLYNGRQGLLGVRRKLETLAET